MRNYYLYYLDTRLKLLEGRRYQIGRTRANDIILPHGSVSREHASLNWEDDTFTIHDLDSTNGVLVNDRVVRTKKLADEDKIKIGDFNLHFIVRPAVPADQTISGITPTPTLAMERQVGELLHRMDDPELAAKVFDLKHTWETRRDELTELAFKDKLTQLFNRRYFDDKLANEAARSLEFRTPLALILLDIDHFKAFNDTHGHQKGDEILCNVAALLREQTRDDDTPARYGGEEMAVILPGTPLADAATIAERLRAVVETETLTRTGLGVTISLGVAQLNDKINEPRKLIRAADDALYRAKDNGRNRLETSE